MTDSDECRCVNCSWTDLAAVETNVIADEFVECRSCLRLHLSEYDPDGTMGLAWLSVRTVSYSKYFPVHLIKSRWDCTRYSPSSQ
jgi:hypothetical protein